MQIQTSCDADLDLLEAPEGSILKEASFGNSQFANSEYIL